MPQDLDALQKDILFASPDELKEKNFLPMDGVAHRDYVITLNVPDAIKATSSGSGVLGGTLRTGEKYVFLEKDGDKDIASYTGTLEHFYFKNLGKNHERILVASFKRSNALQPMKEEVIKQKKFSQTVEQAPDIKFVDGPQSYINLLDLNPATNAVNLTNGLMILPYVTIGGEEDNDLVVTPYNLSKAFGTGLPDLIEVDKDAVAAFNKRGKTKIKLIAALIALFFTAIGLSLIPQDRDTVRDAGLPENTDVPVKERRIESHRKALDELGLR